jgi:hypothetical protein
MKQRLPLVLSLVALAVGLLGWTPVGDAARTVLFPPNSVGNSALKKNAVTSPKVKDHSLLAIDFAAGELPEGPQGPQGPQGPKGDPAIRLFALVSRDGALLSSSGVTSVAHPGLGKYDVSFNQNLGNCALVAGTNGWTYEADAWAEGSTVHVSLLYVAGAAFLDGDFSVIAAC